MILARIAALAFVAGLSASHAFVCAEEIGVVRVEARVEQGRAIVSFNGAQIARGLILTCGHCCRSAGGPGGHVTVHLLREGSWSPVRSVSGTVLCMDSAADCGLIRIDDPDALETIYALAPRGTPARVGAPVYHYRWQKSPERLTAGRARITRLNPYLGPAVIETDSMPRSGESGGPLIDAERRQIIGVTSAADVGLQRGIYCGLEPIYEMLDRCGELEAVTSIQEPSESIRR